ncbi:MAG: DUF1353 domain-containing protein [Hyphomicrobium sp.]|nr:DUF1353 domain-containing protein [Hyphomicrobium sp.]
MKIWIVLAVFIFAASSSANAFVQATSNPNIRLFQGDGVTFALQGPLVYRINLTNAAVFIPSGFVTDFASVPWFAQSVVSVLGRHSVPAIVHDYLYWHQKCTRKEADLILYATMQEYDANWFQRHAVYWMVRIFGGWSWNENAESKKSGFIRILPAQWREIPENKDWRIYRQELLEKGITEKLEGGANAEGDRPNYCSLDRQD